MEGKTVTNRRGRSTGRIAFAVAVAIAAGTPVRAALPDAGTPDFTGVWQPVDPPLMIKTADNAAPPLLPAAAKLYAANSAKAIKGDRSWDPSSNRCLPPGEPRIMTEAMPFEIFQTKDQILFGYQWGRLNRFVSLDRPLKLLTASYLGTSVGTFEKDTLVVDVHGFNTRFFLDRAGMPHSAALKLTERFSLKDGGRSLEARIRFEDPQTFSAPWVAVLHFRKVPNGRIREDICPLREKLVPDDLQFFDPAANSAPSKR